MLPGKQLPPHVRYKIRQNATFIYTTKNVRKQTWTPGPGSGSYRYYQFGFVWVQVSDVVLMLLVVLSEELQ